MNDEIEELTRLRKRVERQVIELLRLREKLAYEMRETIRYTTRAMTAVEVGETAPPPEALPPLIADSEQPQQQELELALDFELQPALILELEVGPLPSFPIVSELELQLGLLAGVTDVYVVRYDGSKAQIEVALATADAAEAFHAWLEERFQVEQVGEDRFVLYTITTGELAA